MHPLADIGNRIKVETTITTSVTSEFDIKGNPIFIKETYEIELLVLIKRDQAYFRNAYSVEASQGRKFVTLYILRVWKKDTGGLSKIPTISFDISKLSAELISLDGTVKFSILDKSQSNLIPITEVFGTQLIAMQSGDL